MSIITSCRVAVVNALLGCAVLLAGCGNGDLAGAGHGPIFGDPASSYCIRASVPPPVPDQGAVLWSPPGTNPAQPNVIVLAYSNELENKVVLSPDSACTQVLKNLQTITIAPGGRSALLAVCTTKFSGGTAEGAVPWGAVNVSAADPKPLDFTRCWDFIGESGDKSMYLAVTSPLKEPVN